MLAISVRSVVVLGLITIGLSVRAETGRGPVDLTKGLIGHWKLAGDARDHSGTGLDTQVHGGVDFQVPGRDGRTGTAAGFNGRDAYLEVPAAEKTKLGTRDF